MKADPRGRRRGGSFPTAGFRRPWLHLKRRPSPEPSGQKRRRHCRRPPALNHGILTSMPRAPDIVGCALDDRYELAEMLGEGAFGRVYRARDRRLGRAVAVKVIKPWWADDSAWVQRFQREAQMLARVNDPGVVQIFDIGDAEEGPYYVAELVEGESLADRLRRGPLPVAAARDIAEQLCRALASAHREVVVHCDVNPANV